MKRRVACVLANGFEDSEFKQPVDSLTKAGFQVDIIAARKGEKLVGKAGKVEIQSTTSIDDADVSSYLALLIPGGKSPATLCEDQKFVGFVKQFIDGQKPIAAICHGPQLLMAAGSVKGRTMTGYEKIQGDLKSAGARVKDEALVTDGPWITSRQPSDLPQFCAAIVEQFSVNANQSWAARGDVHPEA